MLTTFDFRDNFVAYFTKNATKTTTQTFYIPNTNF